jgi:hypothetical protein
MVWLISSGSHCKVWLTEEYLQHKSSFKILGLLSQIISQSERCIFWLLPVWRVGLKWQIYSNILIPISLLILSSLLNQIGQAFPIPSQ